ncbi:thiamine pyrophosphate-binding protein [Muricoccus vinaceus]|uniref:Thiamine pyrophosphate-binding protein n=1 Tax=Muricoccus vinaceus TaxID=424704 RepID=A0ABV6IPM1_9PROT
MLITGAELIARCLITNGITHAFNVPGVGIHPLLDALKRHHGSIRYLTGPSETAVGLMADGFGRATGRPAFVNLYHASGTALAFMGLTTAWADRSPMLFTTTTGSRRLERRDQYATVPGDITEATRQFTKWSWEVPMAERIPEAIARATLIASTPPMGPVHLAFPMDLYTEEVDEEVVAALAPMARPDRLRLFREAPADPAGIAAAVGLLREARRPLLVAGGDVTQLRAVPALVALAEALSAPVMSEPYVAYLGFPNDHPLYAGRFSPASPVVQEADVVLVAGAEFTASTPTSTLPPETAKVIFLSPDLLDFGKQIWADVGLLGHPAATLRALAESLAADGRSPERLSWAAEHGSARQVRLGKVARQGREETPVRVPRLIDEVQAAFGDDAILVDHSTTGTAYMLDLCRLGDPSRYFGISARASAQGWGLPAAIGIQLAVPDRRVVVVVGDGGFMFTGNSLHAAALWKAPVVVIVLRNGGWHDVAQGARANRGWTEAELSSFGWLADPPVDYVGFARSLGVAGLRVERVEDLAPALQAARDAACPMLIEVNTDPGAVDYYIDWTRR